MDGHLQPGRDIASPLVVAVDPVGVAGSDAVEQIAAEKVAAVVGFAEALELALRQRHRAQQVEQLLRRPAPLPQRPSGLFTQRAAASLDPDPIEDDEAGEDGEDGRRGDQAVTYRHLRSMQPDRIERGWTKDNKKKCPGPGGPGRERRTALIRDEPGDGTASGSAPAKGRRRRRRLLRDSRSQPQSEFPLTKSGAQRPPPFDTVPRSVCPLTG